MIKAYRVMVHYVNDKIEHVILQVSGYYKWGKDEFYNDEIEAREAAYRDGHKLNMRMHGDRDRESDNLKYIGFHVEPCEV